MKYLPLIFPLLMAAIAFFAFSESGRALAHDFLAGAGRRPPYKRRSVMTENELDFHRTLRLALPDGNWELWPQVSMAAFIAPIDDRTAKDPAQRHASALEMQAELTAMLRILDQMSKSEDYVRGLGT